MTEITVRLEFKGDLVVATLQKSRLGASRQTQIMSSVGQGLSAKPPALAGRR